MLLLDYEETAIHAIGIIDNIVYGLRRYIFWTLGSLPIEWVIYAIEKFRGNKEIAKKGLEALNVMLGIPSVNYLLGSKALYFICDEIVKNFAIFDKNSQLLRNSLDSLLTFCKKKKELTVKILQGGAMQGILEILRSNHSTQTISAVLKFLGNLVYTIC